MKNTTPHESWEQESLVAKLLKEYPDILIETNPMAGAKLTPRQAKFAKKQGYQAGTLDIFLPEYRLYIEMKRQSGGSLTKEQKTRIQQLESAGYSVIVAKGAVDAWSQIQELLKCQN